MKITFDNDNTLKISKKEITNQLRDAFSRMADTGYNHIVRLFENGTWDIYPCTNYTCPAEGYGHGQPNNYIDWRLVYTYYSAAEKWTPSLWVKELIEELIEEFSISSKK